jgi:hypothetical protein
MNKYVNMVRDADIPSPAEKQILWVLADIASEKTPNPYCSHAYIRHCTGLSLTTIGVRLASLRDQELVSWEKRKGTTNIYTLGLKKLEILKRAWNEKTQTSTAAVEGIHEKNVTPSTAAVDVTQKVTHKEPKTDISASAPAVLVLRDAYHRTPDEHQRRQVVEIVGDDLSRWEAYVKHWVAKGYNVFDKKRKKYSLSTLLDAFTEGNADHYLKFDSVQQQPVGDVVLVKVTEEEFYERRANAKRLANGTNP